MSHFIIAGHQAGLANGVDVLQDWSVRKSFGRQMVRRMQMAQSLPTQWDTHTDTDTQDTHRHGMSTLSSKFHICSQFLSPDD